MATPRQEHPRRSRPLDLGREIREFVRSHAGGWHHGDWVQFLERLRKSGYDVSAPEQIGRDLERARLAEALSGLGVSGLGPRRRDALVDHFGTLWELKHASVDQIARAPGINSELAAKIRAALN